MAPLTRSRNGRAAACSPSSAGRLPRVLLSGLAFTLLVLANLGQHRWHPPLSLVEAQAAKDLGGADWRAKFDPYATTNGEKLWTPAHEARLQDFSGKAVYLTACTIFLQAAYQGLSLLAELSGAPALVQLTYSSAAFVNGFGVLVCCMFLFFWGLQTAVHPEWRAQWNFFERSGYPLYMPLMCLVHLPSLACGFVDVASKDRALLRARCPSRLALLKASTAYHALFEAWLYTNWAMCGHAIPYPWYYDIQLSAHPVLYMLAYLLSVNTMASGLVLAYRRYILWWVAPPPKKKA